MNTSVELEVLAETQDQTSAEWAAELLLSLGQLRLAPSRPDWARDLLAGEPSVWGAKDGLSSLLGAEDSFRFLDPAEKGPAARSSPASPSIEMTAEVLDSPASHFGGPPVLVGANLVFQPGDVVFDTPSGVTLIRPDAPHERWARKVPLSEDQGDFQLPIPAGWAHDPSGLDLPL